MKKNLLLTSIFISLFSGSVFSAVDDYEQIKQSVLLSFKENTLEADKNTFELSLKALALLPQQKINQDGDIYLRIGTKLFEKTFFHESYVLDFAFLKKTCLVSYNKKGILFKNAIVMALAEGQIENALEIYDMASLCKINKSFQHKALTSLIGKIDTMDDSNKKIQRLMQFASFDSFTPFLISKLKKTAEELREKKQEAQSLKMEDLIESYYLKHKGKRKNFDLDDVDALAALHIDKLSPFIHEYQIVDLAKENPKKDEFRKVFQVKINSLSVIEKKIQEIVGLGSAQMTYRSCKILAEQYGHLSSQLDNLKSQKENKEDPQVFKVLSDIQQKMKDKIGYLTKRQKEILIKYDILFSKDNYSIAEIGTMPLQGETPAGHLMDKVGGDN